jgi:hypothetical protein
MSRETSYFVQSFNAGKGGNLKADAPIACKSETGALRLGAVMPTLSALLFENGLPDLPVLLIEPHRNHGGVWRIKFSYETGEPLSMSAVQASTMASRLHNIGEAELADEIDGAIENARRYASR